MTFLYQKFETHTFKTFLTETSSSSYSCVGSGIQTSCFLSVLVHRYPGTITYICAFGFSLRTFVGWMEIWIWGIRNAIAKLASLGWGGKRAGAGILFAAINQKSSSFVFLSCRVFLLPSLFFNGFRSFSLKGYHLLGLAWLACSTCMHARHVKKGRGVAREGGRTSQSVSFACLLACLFFGPLMNTHNTTQHNTIHFE